jgi:chorismate synthase
LFLKQLRVEFFAHVSGVGTIESPDLQQDNIEKLVKARESNIVRCADPVIADQMIELIDKTRKAGDTVGGRVSCIIRNCPVGLGEPVFDKLHADLGKAMLSINAVHGFEYGSGFAGTEMNGSEHNDIPVPLPTGEGLGTGLNSLTNFAGGILGGISNGMDITFRVAFKPVATIMQNQPTIDKEGNQAEIRGKGRHDPCVVPRAVAIVEAMAALVIADHYLRDKAYRK